MKILFPLGTLFFSLSLLIAFPVHPHWSGSPLGKISAVILYGRGEVAWHHGDEFHDESETENNHEDNNRSEEPEGGNKNNPTNPTLLRTIQLLQYARACDHSFYPPCSDLAYLLAYRQNKNSEARQLLEESIPQMKTASEKISLKYSLYQLLRYKMKKLEAANEILQSLRTDFLAHQDQLPTGLHAMILATLQKESSIP